MKSTSVKVDLGIYSDPHSGIHYSQGLASVILMGHGV